MHGNGRKVIQAPKVVTAVLFNLPVSFLPICLCLKYFLLITQNMVITAVYGNGRKVIKAPEVVTAVLFNLSVSFLPKLFTFEVFFCDYIFICMSTDSHYTYINHISRTWLLGLPQKQNGRPVEWITPLTHISAKTWTSALIKVCLWSANDGKGSLTTRVRHRHRQSTNPASTKIANCSYSS